MLDDRGGRIDVPGAKRRAQVAALALSPGQAVSSDRLVEKVWGDDSGHNAMNALQALVSKLRHALPPEVLVTGPTGYLLEGDGVRAARLLGAASRLHTRDVAQSKLTYLTTAVMLSAGSTGDRIERAAREKMGDEAFIEASAAGGPEDLADAAEAVTGRRPHELQVRSDPHDPRVAGSNRGPATP